MKRLWSIAIIMFWAAALSVAQNSLFTIEQKNSERGYVYTFIERYFEEIQQMHNNAEVLQKMNDDKVFFAHGAISDIKQLHQALPFTLNCFEDRYYEASWQKDGQEYITVIFPVSYELLLAMPKIEIEKTLQNEIVSSVKKASEASTLPIALDQLEKQPNGLYRTNPKKHYQLESLNDCLYYLCDSDGRFSLVCDSAYLEQTVLNMFHNIQSQDYRIDVEQGVYGFKSLHYRLTLNQWVAYCKNKGMTIYTALEEESKSVLRILIVAECKELGFNHLLSVDIPRDFLTNTTTVWSAKLNGYIPTHNVKDLYQQYKNRPNREVKLN